MTTEEKLAQVRKKVAHILPKRRQLYYGGKWHEPQGGYLETMNPATGDSMGNSAEANDSDVDAAVQEAYRAFLEWRRVKPLERASLLQKVASVIREHGEELALLDAANGGNPVREMLKDVQVAAKQIEFFAGLVTELKGDTAPFYRR